MRRGFVWRVVLPIGLGVLFALAAAVNGASSQPPAESSFGTLPLPPIVGMTGDGYVLTSGVLRSGDHDENAPEGYFAIQTLVLQVPPNSIPATELRNHLGADVEIIIRRRKPRGELETVVR